MAAARQRPAGRHRQRRGHPRTAGARRVLRQQGGVVAYCESLRGELHKSGVKVVTLCPGYIDTPLTQGNRYGMPFLMKAEDFADQALRAIEAGTSYRVIPWQMGVIAKIMRMLPNALLDRAVQGRERKKRSGEG
jgi:short-subunit dehydrogenase